MDPPHLLLGLLLRFPPRAGPRHRRRPPQLQQHEVLVLRRHCRQHLWLHVLCDVEGAHAQEVQQ